MTSSTSLTQQLRKRGSLQLKKSLKPKISDRSVPTNPGTTNTTKRSHGIINNLHDTSYDTSVHA
ncbi:hypothetical protein Csa_023511 [Cucumis sativus]|nr:hypothetical protein Csa_023511 [Cucumis sativus]